MNTAADLSNKCIKFFLKTTESQHFLSPLLMYRFPMFRIKYNIGKYIELKNRFKYHKSKKPIYKNVYLPYKYLNVQKR